MIWCDQKNLIIELTIKENGTVAGKAGDAKLVQGRIKKNRSWFGRKIKVKTDYIVVAELVGPLVKSEGIHRKQLKLPFNLMKGAIQGGAHSSGRKFGGKKHGILSAGNMVLKPVPRTPH